MGILRAVVRQEQPWGQQAASQLPAVPRVHTMLVAGRWQRLVVVDIVVTHDHVMWGCYMSRQVYINLSFAGCTSMKACNGVAMSAAGMAAVTSVVPVVAAVVG